MEKKGAIENTEKLVWEMQEKTTVMDEKEKEWEEK